MRPLNDLRKSEIIVLARDKSKFKQKFLLLLETKEFRKDIKKLRDKWQVDFKEPHLTDGGGEDIKELLKKYSISNNWSYLMHSYITTNRIDDIDDPYGIEIEIPMSKEFATIKIYPETSLTDLRNAYKHVLRNLKGGKAKRTVQAKNFDEDTFMVSLRNKKLSYKDIAERVNEEYGTKLNADDVSRRLNRINKRKATIK